MYNKILSYMDKFPTCGGTRPHRYNVPPGVVALGGRMQKDTCPSGYMFHG